MDELNNGERQVAPTIDGIRRDHVARYEWVTDDLDHRFGGSLFGVSVFDAACGIGYGAAILADAGADVVACDKSKSAISYAEQHFKREGNQFRTGDLQLPSNWRSERFNVFTCFETIEHLENPEFILSSVDARLLYASVPNEEVFPHQGRIKYHYRHYTREEFRDLLESAGWEVTGWYGQEGPESEVEPDVNGRTIVVTAQRVEDGNEPKSVPIPDTKPTGKVGRGRVITILGLGPSLETYIDHTKRLGGRAAFTDEVWAINALGDLICADRVFHMDDLRVQEARAKAKPQSNIAFMVDWLKNHTGPIYTSQKVDGYPGLVEFPLEEVIKATGQAYFNSTAAYAVALAVYEHITGNEIAVLNLFGMDFAYPNSYHAEKGRACVEFWLGIATAHGIRLGLPDNTSVMDVIEGDDAKFYGYDAVKVIMEHEDGIPSIRFEPRDLPTAAEIENRYDHTRPTNEHVRKEVEKDQVNA